MVKEKTAKEPMFKKGILVKIVSSMFPELAFAGRTERAWNGGSILIDNACKIQISHNKKAQFFKSEGNIAITGKDLFIEELTDKDSWYKYYMQARTGVAVVDERTMKEMGLNNTN